MSSGQSRADEIMAKLGKAKVIFIKFIINIIQSSSYISIQRRRFYYNFRFYQAARLHIKMETKRSCQLTNSFSVNL